MASNIIQEKMDIFYDYFQENEELKYNSVCKYFKDQNKYDIVIATMLGNMHYQIENGGVDQWVFNRYAKDTLDDIYKYVESASKIFPNNKPVQNLFEWLKVVSNIIKNSVVDEYSETIIDHKDEMTKKYFALVPNVEAEDCVLVFLVLHYQEILNTNPNFYFSKNNNEIQNMSLNVIDHIDIRTYREQCDKCKHKYYVDQWLCCGEPILSQNIKKKLWLVHSSYGTKDYCDYYKEIDTIENYTRNELEFREILKDQGVTDENIIKKIIAINREHIKIMYK